MNARHATSDGHRVENFAAELTAAVYQVVLRHGAGERWLELELGLWHSITGTMDKWVPEFSGNAGHRKLEPDPS
jgi:hypothetical protein